MPAPTDPYYTPSHWQQLQQSAGSGTVPDWAPNTPYKANQLVRDPNGDLQRANADFTSGATFNATNWTPVAGGVFLPLGDSAVANSYAQAPDATVATITQLAVGAASTIAGAVTTGAVAAITAGTQIVTPIGAHLAQAGATFPDTGYVKPNSQTAGQGAQAFSQAFMLDPSGASANAFEFAVKETSSARYRVRVNGKLVAEAWGAVATNLGGNVPVHVDLPSNALVRIDVEFGDSTLAGAWAFSPGAIVTPIPAPAFRGIFFSDSYGEPTNANGADGLGSTMLRDAGIDDAWQSGYGGSGYVQVGGSGTQKTFVQRGATDIDPFGPWDLITVMDIDNTTAAATLQAAATQFWADRRAANPNAVLVAFGAVYKSNVATVDTAQDLAVKAAVEAVGGVFVSMASAIPDSYFAADGTHMKDGPSNEYAGHIMYTRLRDALRAKGIATAARQSSTAGNLAAHNAAKNVHGFADITQLAKLRQPDVQVFTASGTWNKPANVTTVRVICQGGGGGGGSGRVSASGTAAAGGGGGGGGGRTQTDFKATQLPASVTVSIGGGGGGGAAQATDSTNGNNGGNGGATTFSTYVTANAGIGGGGGTTSAGTAGGGGAGGGTGGTGGAGGTGAGGAASQSANAAGGGAGGGVSTVPAAAAGGAGGANTQTARTTGGNGGAIGAAGAIGTSDADTTIPFAGTGGGGGGSALTGAGGAGGAGGAYGGGGGGGGAALNAQGGSGVGGAGKSGICVVIAW